MTVEDAAPLYQAFYCEENIWQLARARREAGQGGEVVLITNEAKSAALWSQRAAAPGEPVTWDYHVILIAPPEEPGGESASAPASETMVWDLDTRLGCPVGFRRYVEATFAPPGVLPVELEPRFRVMPMGDYLERFSSDRSHMRTASGRYRQPPPPWPLIVVTGEPSFLDWLDEKSDDPGRWRARWLSLGELLGRC